MSGFFSLNVVPVLHCKDVQTALSTNDRVSEVLLATGLKDRVDDGIRTRDIQIHNLAP